ncbi:MAG: class I SAM-dependent methyltransferase [Thermodesulfobacteriota bacterium]
MNAGTKDHWDRVYAANEINRLGWYEAAPEPSISLISKCRIGKDDPILDVGAGASTLIDYLLDQGYSNITVLDISETALEKLKERLGEEKSRRVRWIVDDITEPAQMAELRDVALWHDRALLHFLLGEKEREMYLTVLNRSVRIGGYVIIAAFSLTGARKCSGLDVMNYDQRILSDFLGKDYCLIEYFDYLYYTPSGQERPYIYTLFRRKQSKD